jgi:hypothetical protein
MTSLRQCGEQLFAVPQVGRHLFDEGVCRQEFFQRHHDRELGDQFVAANAAEIESGVAVTGALALDDVVDEILRRPEEIGHSHFAHDCFCPSQRNNHFGMPKTERKLNVGFPTQVSRCFVLGTAQLSENLLARRIPLAASQLPALRRWPFPFRRTRPTSTGQRPSSAALTSLGAERIQMGVTWQRLRSTSSRCSLGVF